MWTRGWEVTPTRIQGPFTSGNFLGIQRSGEHHDIHSEGEGKLLSLTPFTM